MSLIFLPYPGTRERHLQRQYQNPLFTAQQRDFDEQRLTGARYMDEQEELEFTEKFHLLLEEVAQLKENEGSEVMLDLKSRLDQSYEQCCGLSGKRDNEKLAIKQLVQVIMNSIWQAAQGDAEAEQNLKEEELARTTHYQLLSYPLVVDLLRPRSPIAKDQLVATLLSEPEEAVNAAFQLFDKEHQTLIYQQAKELLAEFDEPILEQLGEAQQRLEQMAHLYTSH